MQRLWLVVLIAIVPALPACKKKEAGTAAGSGSDGSAAAPAGSATAPAGSAAAPAGSAGSADGSAGSAAAGSAGSAAAGSAGSGSAAEPAAPPPPAGKIAVKRGGRDAGMFDGDKALFIKNGADRAIIAPQNCEKFSCASIKKGDIDYDKLKKDCPSASWLTISLNSAAQPGEPKVGPTKVMPSVGSYMSGGGLTAGWADGGTLDEVTADQVKGKIDLTDGDSSAHGTFTAKTCK
jgi:hypothetical protein